MFRLEDFLQPPPFFTNSKDDTIHVRDFITASDLKNYGTIQVPVSPFNARPIFCGLVISACEPVASMNQMIA